MNKKYRLIKNLPFQKADDTEWEIRANDNCRDGSWWFTDNESSRFRWDLLWGNPFESGFFEEIKPARWWSLRGNSFFYIHEDASGIGCQNSVGQDKAIGFELAAHKLGNYFKSEADAQLALDKYIKPAFYAAHEELGY